MGAGLVAPLEPDPGQPDDRDRVVRIGAGGLLVEPLGLVDQAQAEGLLRLDHQLDHRSSVSIAWARSRSVGPSFWAGSLITTSTSRSRIGPEGRALGQAELADQVVAIDREAGPVEDGLRLELLRDPGLAARPARRRRPAARCRGYPPGAGRGARPGPAGPIRPISRRTAVSLQLDS